MLSRDGQRHRQVGWMPDADLIPDIRLNGVKYCIFSKNWRQRSCPLPQWQLSKLRSCSRAKRGAPQKGAQLKRGDRLWKGVSMKRGPAWHPSFLLPWSFFSFLFHLLLLIYLTCGPFYGFMSSLSHFSSFLHYNGLAALAVQCKYKATAAHLLMKNRNFIFLNKVLGMKNYFHSSTA